MSQYFRNRNGGFSKLIVVILCLIVAACAALALVLLSGGEKGPFFHDVTIELGQPLPALDAFLTKNAKPEKASFVTDVNSLDLSRTGQVHLTLRYGSDDETVTVTVQDTTPPRVEFKDVYADLSTTLKPEDFVVSVTDESECTVSFGREVMKPETYSDETALIVVTDAGGNTTQQECKIYYRWMIDTFTLEYGQTLKKSDLLLSSSVDDSLLPQSKIDEINRSPVGTYTIVSTNGGFSCQCVVKVVDTTPPTLKLRSVEIFIGETAELEDFVESFEDLSGDVTLTMVTKLDLSKPGTFTVVIEAKDIYGNVTREETTLIIDSDTTPPYINGLYDLYVSKGQEPDYTYGVYAWDERDGEVSFTYDASGVDLNHAGTYYAVYRAVDTSGNEGVYRRRVVVDHDAVDTAELVAQIAATLSSDVEAIRDYVRYNVWYSTEYGGDDPIWYGFVVGNGNCYVHAVCFQALLQAKGYTTQLIWTTDQTHYWNLVWLNGRWVHMDATPGTYHEIYSIMNDDQRYETLSGRDWDRDLWPACP